MGTLELVGVTPKYLTTVNSSSFETFGLGSQVPVRKVIRSRFRSSHFLFFVFGHFWQQSYKNMKVLRSLCLHFVFVLHGKKTERKSHN